MKTDLEVIDEVIEILTPEVWIQGTWCVLPGEKWMGVPLNRFDGSRTIRNDTPVTKMCLDGALRLVVYGTPKREFGDDFMLAKGYDQYCRVYEKLSEVINNHHPITAGGRPVTVRYSPRSFNDAENRTFEDVALILKHTREELAG